MDVLVTGVQGFVGRHLVRELKQAGHVVLGLGSGGSAGEELSVDYYRAHDMTKPLPDLPAVDAVVHLAALAAVGPSFGSPQQYINTNSSMVTNLGEYLLKKSPQTLVLLISSGAVYSSSAAMPIREDGVLGHGSPYVVSKILTEHQAAYYAGRGGRWMVARPFNHFGPGQASGFLLPDLYDGLTQAERTNGDRFMTGDLTTSRDYTDVRDVVRAYRLLLESDLQNLTTVNVCSGTATTGEELLAVLRSCEVGRTVETVLDEARVRPNDPKQLFGSPDKLRHLTGWEPTISLNQTVRDFVEFRRGAKD
ncbi:NAD-dependent epimerase/dehydratase family protein [Nocardioides campestrisoli]|uniref:NAD-dependent epimerase/dehydratase family protein n=1 Tax=Nocardioides campestrisoli TaxID=2736757 RepID=UPI00163DE45A|nr:NAD-dependent epimerase/dehydratase family protein [Nocardioides campestrisoli]